MINTLVAGHDDLIASIAMNMLGVAGTTQITVGMLVFSANKVFCSSFFRLATNEICAVAFACMLLVVTGIIVEVASRRMNVTAILRTIVNHTVVILTVVAICGADANAVQGAQGYGTFRFHAN